MVILSNFAAAQDADFGPGKDTLSIGITAGVFLPDTDVHDFYAGGSNWQPLNPVGPAMGLRLSYDLNRNSQLTDGPGES